MGHTYTHIYIGDQYIIIESHPWIIKTHSKVDNLIFEHMNIRILKIKKLEYFSHRSYYFSYWLFSY